jgi:hypothetical protein
VVTFSWTAGTGADLYQLDVGTTAGSPNTFTSGFTTARSATVGGLPTSGGTVARLWSRINGGWSYDDYTYVAAAAAAAGGRPVLGDGRRRLSWTVSSSQGSSGVRGWTPMHRGDSTITHFLDLPASREA